MQEPRLRVRYSSFDDDTAEEDYTTEEPYSGLYTFEEVSVDRPKLYRLMRPRAGMRSPSSYERSHPECSEPVLRSSKSGKSQLTTAEKLCLLMLKDKIGQVGKDLHSHQESYHRPKSPPRRRPKASRRAYSHHDPSTRRSQHGYDEMVEDEECSKMLKKVLSDILRRKSRDDQHTYSKHRQAQQAVSDQSNNMSKHSPSNAHSSMKIAKRPSTTCLDLSKLNNAETRPRFGYDQASQPQFVLPPTSYPSMGNVNIGIHQRRNRVIPHEDCVISNAKGSTAEWIMNQNFDDY